MGSPYQIDTVSRVSVVRSRIGLKKAVLSLTKFCDDRIFAINAIAKLDSVVAARELVDSYETDLSTVSEDIYNSSGHDNLVQFIIELYTTYLECKYSRSRRVSVISARYAWRGSESFGAAIVFDLTAKTDSLRK